MLDESIRVGTAAWSIPALHKHRFPSAGSHLERYARCLNAVEINSSFYRPHRRSTYERWAASVPETFRFSVKVPRAITHDARLDNCKSSIDGFLAESSGLGSRLGLLLVQLPPSLPFDLGTADGFFAFLRQRTSVDIASEPRHRTWFSEDATELLIRHRIARVAADPPPSAGADEPAGWHGCVYYRLHGSPRIYYSNYDEAALTAVAAKLVRHRKGNAPVWCIFDNTAEAAATGNALRLTQVLGES